MSHNTLNIKILGAIMEFDNFVYTEHVESIIQNQNEPVEIEYIFPTTTSTENELIVLNEN